MNLRDQIATALIGATFSRPFHISDKGMEDNARDAYHQADVMLRVRELTPAQLQAVRDEEHARKRKDGWS